MTRRLNDPRAQWHDALQGADCLAIERLSETLMPAEERHLASCAHCQAEQALLREFETSETRADEAAHVEAIIAQLHRRNVAAPSNVIRPRFGRGLATVPSRTMAAVAAVLLLVVAAAWFVEQREPGVDVISTGTAYRSAGLEVVAPAGDVAGAPVELRWKPARGANTYAVDVREVDGTLIWNGTTPSASVSLPRAVVAQFVPGKSILWKVTAVRNDGSAVADSGTQKFRVTVKSSGSNQ